MDHAVEETVHVDYAVAVGDNIEKMTGQVTFYPGEVEQISDEITLEGNDTPDDDASQPIIITAKSDQDFIEYGEGQDRATATTQQLDDDNYFSIKANASSVKESDGDEVTERSNNISNNVIMTLTSDNPIEGDVRIKTHFSAEDATSAQFSKLINGKMQPQWQLDNSMVLKSGAQSATTTLGLNSDNSYEPSHLIDWSAEIIADPALEDRILWENNLSIDNDQFTLLDEDTLKGVLSLINTVTGINSLTSFKESDITEKSVIFMITGSTDRTMTIPYTLTATSSDPDFTAILTDFIENDNSQKSIQLNATLATQSISKVLAGNIIPPPYDRASESNNIGIDDEQPEPDVTYTLTLVTPERTSANPLIFTVVDDDSTLTLQEGENRFSSNSLPHVETLVGSGGTDRVTLLTAASLTLVGVDEVIGSSGDDRLSFSGEQSMTLQGGAGADSMANGDPDKIFSDIYRYDGAEESSLDQYDTLVNFRFDLDKIALKEAVTAVNSPVSASSLEEESLKHALEQAGSGFDISVSGDISAALVQIQNQSYLAIDWNHNDLFDRQGDILIQVIGTTQGKLDLTDFTLF